MQSHMDSLPPLVVTNRTDSSYSMVMGWLCYSQGFLAESAAEASLMVRLRRWVLVQVSLLLLLMVGSPNYKQCLSSLIIRISIGPCELGAFSVGQNFLSEMNSVLSYPAYF